MDNNSYILILLALLIVMIIVILFVNSRYRRQMTEMKNIRQQLDDLKAVPVGVSEGEICEEEVPQENAVAEIIELTEEKQDAAAEEITETEASAYNTGKSGKIYTKEELELLIKE